MDQLGDQGDIDALREHLIIYYGTDWDVTDDALLAAAKEARDRVQRSGRRWSWTVLAGEALKRDLQP